jgi:integrase
LQRLRFFRSLDSLRADGRLLARPRTKEALVRQLRDYLHQVCHALGLPTRIVPHQFRHSYASEMLRAGVSLLAVMKLLGQPPEMTMRYLDVVLTNLQREFELARAKPRHLLPQPQVPFVSLRPGLNGVIDSLLAAQHVLEMFRRVN